MIDSTRAGAILSEMVQVGRIFRTAGQRNGQRSLIGTRFGFLQHLSHRDARLTELAHRLLVSAPVASRAIDSLEADGMVERRTDPDDARASLISITGHGRAKLTESESDAVNRFADALSEWSPADAEQAISILRKLNVHLAEVLDSQDSSDGGFSNPLAATATNPKIVHHGNENHG